MKKSHTRVCRYCGAWKADRLDNLRLPVCGLCSFMLYRVKGDCLLTRADLVLKGYRSEWAKNLGRVSRDILAFKGARVAGQIISGMIEARCKCAACANEKPASIARGGSAVG